MSSKSFVVGSVAFALGVAGARLSSSTAAAVPLRQQPISITTAGEVVTFQNNTTGTRFVIVGFAAQAGASSSFTRDVKVAATGVKEFVIYEVAARWISSGGIMTACKPDPNADCPVPPPPPPATPVGMVAELKPAAVK